MEDADDDDAEVLNRGELKQMSQKLVKIHRRRTPASDDTSSSAGALPVIAANAAAPATSGTTKRPSLTNAANPPAVSVPT
jgi:hypothetical protein